MSLSRRQYLSLAALLAGAVFYPPMLRAEDLDWNKITSRAMDQDVYFNAWGGDARINAYIAWAAMEIEAKFGIRLHHVKLADTGEGVSRIVAEKSAGRDRDGSVDLIWLNGENFAALKKQHLLYGPFTQYLPNMLFVDQENPAVNTDFTVPVDRMEAPWGLAQLIFFYHSGKIAAPPKSLDELLKWLGQNKGRFTYPAPPEFLGTTFLKQVLLEKGTDRPALAKEASKETFDRVTAPLWNFLDRLHPLLWRSGKVFPKNAGQQRQLVNDGEIDIYFAFNPSDASSGIAQGLLPNAMKPFTFNGGTIANAHFLAIPYNAKAKEAAMVVANFLLSPEAQMRKMDPREWGDPTVLEVNLLMPQDRSGFDKLPLGIATPSSEQMGKKLPEPHPSWVALLEKEWARRYAS